MELPQGMIRGVVVIRVRYSNKVKYGGKVVSGGTLELSGEKIWKGLVSGRSFAARCGCGYRCLRNGQLNAKMYSVAEPTVVPFPQFSPLFFSRAPVRTMIMVSVVMC